eukprot:790014-Amphidinium_carterae.2
MGYIKESSEPATPNFALLKVHDRVEQFADLPFFSLRRDHVMVFLLAFDCCPFQIRFPGDVTSIDLVGLRRGCR